MLISKLVYLFYFLQEHILEDILYENRTALSLNLLPIENRICLFDLLKTVLSRECPVNAASNDLKDTVCCEQAFPFEPKVLQTCMKDVAFLTQYISKYEKSLYENLYYNKETGLIKAVEYVHSTSYMWTTNYYKISELHKSIAEFFKEQLQYTIVHSNNASHNEEHFENQQQSGFFVSDFDFYDFQNSLLNGTVKSCFITLTVFFVILLLTTRNIVATLFSLVTITLTLSSTVGTLTLFGWQLNVVESISTILAIGLAINFSVYFGLFYCSFVSINARKNANETRNIFYVRENNTKTVVKHVGSAVFVSSLVTCLVGVSLTLSSLASFQAYGVLILIVIGYSCLYAYFLFLPLCSIATEKMDCFKQGTRAQSGPARELEMNKRLRRIDESGYTTS